MLSPQGAEFVFYKFTIDMRVILSTATAQYWWPSLRLGLGPVSLSSSEEPD